MIYIHTKNTKRWLKIINEANDFYVLDRGGVVSKKDIDNVKNFEMEPIDILLILMKKNVNICDEICGCDYEHYLNKTKNCDDEFILTKSEFEEIKKIHTALVFGKERKI